MPELHCELMSASSYAPTEPHWVVCQTKAQSAAASKATEWAAPQGTSLVGLPHRSSCVSNFSFCFHFCAPGYRTLPTKASFPSIIRMAVHHCILYLSLSRSDLVSANRPSLPFYPDSVLILRMTLIVYCRLRDGRRG